MPTAIRLLLAGAVCNPLLTHPIFVYVNAALPMSTSAPKQSLKTPLVVMVGRVNVGKSTLFNRLCGKRYALVSRVPGATRDRRAFLITRGTLPFSLVDTAGFFGPIDQNEDPELLASVEQQRQRAIEEAHFVWLVCDACEGFLPLEQDIAKTLLRTGKPFGIALNKAENQHRARHSTEFYGLGAQWVLPFSALHGNGIKELLAQTCSQLLQAGFTPPPTLPNVAGDGEAVVDTGVDAGGDVSKPVGKEAKTKNIGQSKSSRVAKNTPLKFALLGKPNVGKSSLANALLGEQRLIVSNKPGSTREAIETPFVHQGQSYVLMDSAGLRRKAKVTTDLETLGALHTLEALWQMDVVILVLDASQPPSDQDCRLAGYIEKRRKAVVVALNKWDLLKGSAGEVTEVEAAAKKALGFIEYAPFLRMSANTGVGVPNLLRHVQKAAQHHRKWFSTPDVNRVVEWIVSRTPPPAKGSSPTTIRYGLQTHSAPPTFQLFTNRPKSVTLTYQRFFQKQLRYHLKLQANPIILHWKQTPRAHATVSAFQKHVQKGPYPKSKTALKSSRSGRQQRRR